MLAPYKVPMGPVVGPAGKAVFSPKVCRPMVLKHPVGYNPRPHAARSFRGPKNSALTSAPLLFRLRLSVMEWVRWNPPVRAMLSCASGVVPNMSAPVHSFADAQIPPKTSSPDRKVEPAPALKQRFVPMNMADSHSAS